MNSTTFLRHAFSSAPPRLQTTGSVTRRLPLTFCCNVSSTLVLVKKSNESYNQFGRCNKNNNDNTIWCNVLSKGSPDSKDNNKFPSPNARTALESLLCFTFDDKTTHGKIISNAKKKALQELLNKKPDDAVKTMEHVYNTCINNPGELIKYDAILAFIQILFQSGKPRYWQKAVLKLNELKKIPIDDKPSDARPSLYEAIVYTLLNDKGKEDFIKNKWDTYIDHISSDEPPTDTQ